jgi:hypothetical protein
LQERGVVRASALFLALLQAFPLSAKPPQSIKEQANAISIGGKLTVRKTDETEYHGRLESAGSATFSINEVDLHASVTISYTDVARVSKNYGRKGFGGGRVDPRRSLIVAPFSLPHS